MVTSQTVIQSVIDLINSNITDINTERGAKGLTWVYDDAERMDITSYPKIRVIAPGSISVPHSLCSNEQRFTTRLEVQVRVKKGSNFLISGVSKRDVEVLDYLSKQVTDLLRLPANRTTLLDDDSVFYFELEAENTTYGEIIFRQLIIKTILVR